MTRMEEFGVSLMVIVLVVALPLVYILCVKKHFDS